jgi:hypothetical protein
MAMDLRPLTLGELLDRAFSLYRAHFRTFVAIMALPAALAAGGGMLAEALGSVASFQEDPDLGALLVAGGFLGAIFLLMIVYSVTYAVAFGATTAAVSEAYMGRPATAAGAYRHVRTRMGRLILLLLHVTLRLMGVFVVGLLIAVPAGVGIGILVSMSFPGTAAWVGGLASLALVLVVSALTGCFGLRYALSFAALVLEPITAAQAVSRSVELTRGHFWRLLLLVVFAVVIAYITAFLFQGPFLMGAAFAGPNTASAFWLTLIGGVAGAIAGAVSGPIMVVALALLYYDARVRHEGFDLQLMMQNLDSAAPSSHG